MMCKIFFETPALEIVSVKITSELFTRCFGKLLKNITIRIELPDQFQSGSCKRL